jgi:16S rRNA G966 N2-methylase RsmD
VDEGDVLAPGGIAIVQIHPKERQDVPLRRLRLFDERRYGSTLLLFYRLEEGEANGTEAAPAAEDQAG